MLQYKDITYDPITGYFYRNGKRAGSLAVNGYRVICVDYKDITEHRLVFLMVDGKLPDHDVDHINGIRDDNRLVNLRKVTRQQNLFNRGKTVNKSLPKNIYSHGKKYRVKMKIDGVTNHFGYFDDLEMAELVAAEVADKYHGEYARHE